MKTSFGWIVKLSSSPVGNLLCHVIYLSFHAQRVAILNKYVHLHVNSWPEILHRYNFIQHDQVCTCAVDPQLWGFICTATFFLDENIYLHRTSLFSQPIHQIKDFKRWPTVKDLALREKKHTLESALEGPNWIYNNKKPFKSWNSWLSPSCSKNRV